MRGPDFILLRDSALPIRSSSETEGQRESYGKTGSEKILPSRRPFDEFAHRRIDLVLPALGEMDRIGEIGVAQQQEPAGHIRVPASSA